MDGRMQSRCWDILFVKCSRRELSYKNESAQSHPQPKPPKFSALGAPHMRSYHLSAFLQLCHCGRKEDWGGRKTGAPEDGHFSGLTAIRSDFRGLSKSSNPGTEALEIRNPTQSESKRRAKGTETGERFCLFPTPSPDTGGRSNGAKRTSMPTTFLAFASDTTFTAVCIQRNSYFLK